MGTIRRLAGSDDSVGMTDQTGWLCGGENQQTQQNHTDGEEEWEPTNVTAEGGGPPKEAHPRRGTMDMSHFGVNLSDSSTNAVTLAEGSLSGLFNAVTLAGSLSLTLSSSSPCPKQYLQMLDPPYRGASFPFGNHLMTSQDLLNSAVPAVPSIPDSGASAEQ